MAPVCLEKLTEQQRDHVISCLEELTDYLDAHNPTVTSHHAGTKEFLGRLVKSIMAHPLFVRSEIYGEPDVVQSHIGTFLRNWKNNTFRPSRKPAASWSNSLPSLSSCKTPTVSQRVAESLDNAIRSMVLLDCDMRPKDLFFRLSPQAYQDHYDQLIANGSSIPGAVSKARMKSWAEADQGKWEHHKEELEGDLESNRAMFPDIMQYGLQQNLDWGVLGTSLLGLMYAFHDDDNSIQHGIIYAGYDLENKGEIAHKPAAHENLTKTWLAHAQTFLPHISRSDVDPKSHMEMDNNSPVLKTLDVADYSPREIQRILRHYLELVWSESLSYPPDNDMPTIPWSRIEGTPDVFFDIRLFNLPVPLTTDAPCSPESAPTLFRHLLMLQQTGSQFRFYDKTHIDKALAQLVQDLLNNIEKDDEDLVGPHSPKAMPLPPVTPPRPGSSTAFSAIYRMYSLY
ncbi:hypothetical protein BJ165DRAFT_1353268 [Panaeolus papilionaceus]|nr:hypothetical protein BJ165DRAFT_1353268 [Panaeolus papilionaceus]